ncbi:MAG: DUF4428 domain-containing protein [Eubacterium sp.]|nr:DUF4428 domain-containing protein [Eubacterium sp.]
MGLFDAKYCSICGEKIGLLGNRKLEDGNCCKDCASKLSPFFSERRHSTVDEIKDQLAYREQNQQNLSYFNPTLVLGNNTKVYIDQNSGTFVVSSANDWRKTNPDIINLNQVTGVFTEPKEHRREIYRKDSEGHSVSYEPKRYEYSYEFRTTINVNSPYFDDISFELSSSTKRPTSVNDLAYRNCEQQGMQIQQALTGSGGMGMGINNMGMGNMGMNSGLGQRVSQNVGGVAGGILGQVINAAENGLAGNNMNQGMGMNGMNQQGMGMNGMNQGMGMNGMNQGMNQGMGMNGMNQGMGMNGMNQQGMGMNGMNQGMGMNGMNQQGMGMNGMNQGMGMNGMNQGMGMNGMNQGMGMNGMNQGMGMNNMNAGQMAPAGWVCEYCGTTNTGDFCTGCSSPKPM